LNLQAKVTGEEAIPLVDEEEKAVEAEPQQSETMLEVDEDEEALAKEELGRIDLVNTQNEPDPGQPESSSAENSDRITPACRIPSIRSTVSQKEAMSTSAMANFMTAVLCRDSDAIRRFLQVS
jgi:hypothetical protein